MANNSHAKNQHYVPQFILKQFSDRKNRVWVYDKKNGKKFKTKISNIGAETGFYDFTIKGYDMTFEPSLSKIESSASSILKRIISNKSISTSPAERHELARYFSLQFVRTPQWRHMWDNMTSNIFQKIRELGGNPKDLEGYEEPSKENTKRAHMEQIYSHEDYAEFFFNKCWILAETPQNHPFWISDNPISLQNINDFGPYGNLGLGSPGIEIYCPITSSLCIGMWCPSIRNRIEKTHQQYLKLIQVAPQLAQDPKCIKHAITKKLIDSGSPLPYADQQVLNHNSLQVIHSSRFLFSKEDDFSLADRMISEHPRFREGPKPTI